MSEHPAAAKPLTSRKSGSLGGVFPVPGDKSISHRALIFGALSEGRTTISGLLESEDILCTARALQALGAPVEKAGGVWTVTGRGLGGLTGPSGDLDFGNSGTGARLMMGVVAGHPLRAVFTGDASLRKRPMGRVLDPLKQMGLAVEEERNMLPLTLRGASSLAPIAYRLPVPSAQVKSAVLFAGLFAPGRTSVIEREKTRDHTEKMMSYFGADIDATPDPEGGLRISVEGRKTLKGKPVAVPGDPSSAAFLVAAALLCPGSDLVVKDVLINPARIGFYDTLREMDADIAFENEREVNGERVADIRARAGRLKGVTVPAERAPSMIDEYPVLAALSAFAEGETTMNGLQELRVKESDRLAAMAEGLTACGIEAVVRGDTLAVAGLSKVRGGATIQTHMDHRIAMSFLVLGLATEEPVTVDDGSMIATSFPEFSSVLQKAGAAIAAPEA